MMIARWELDQKNSLIIIVTTAEDRVLVALKDLWYDLRRAASTLCFLCCEELL